jgi:hypothetical protein
MDTIDAELARPRHPFNAPVVGATTTLDCSLARCFVFTVSQITTIALTNPPTSSFFTRVLAIITNGNAFAVTWPASVVWLGGGTPTLKVSGVDIIELVTKDGGTTWYGARFDSQRDCLASVTTDAGTGGNAIEVTLHSLVVPAGVMGKNGGVRVCGFLTTTGANSTKKVRFKFGGTTFLLATYAAGENVTGAFFTATVTNRNATNVQYVGGLLFPGPGAVSVTLGDGAGAIDTTAAVTILLTGETANLNDEITMHVTSVELLNPGL